MIGCEHNDFQTDNWKTQVEEILTVCLSFGSKETNIDELVDDDVQDAERDNAAFDDAHASELRVVNKAQVVLVYIVLEHEEYHGKKWYVGDQCREDHGNGKSR